MTRVVWGVLFLVGAFALWSCDTDVTTTPPATDNASATTGNGGSGGSGGGGVGAGGSSTVPQEWIDACAAHSARVCASYYMCFSAFGPYAFGPDEASCTSRFIEACTRNYRPDSGTVAELAACSVAVNGQTVTNDCATWRRWFVHGTANVDWPMECRVTGNLADGEMCSFSPQCQSGWCGGTQTSANLCGTCVTAPAAGQLCPDGVCDYGALCSQGNCIRVGALNDPCGPANPCETDLFCSGGTCTTRIAQGQACSPGQFGCEHNLVCNTTTLLCEPWGNRSDVGGSCWYQTDGSNNLCNDSWCEIDFMTQTGTCIDMLDEGAACGPNNSIILSANQCDTFLNCVGGTCQYYGDASCS